MEPCGDSVNNSFLPTWTGITQLGRRVLILNELQVILAKQNCCHWIIQLGNWCFLSPINLQEDWWRCHQLVWNGLGLSPLAVKWSLAVKVVVVKISEDCQGGVLLVNCRLACNSTTQTNYPTAGNLTNQSWPIIQLDFWPLGTTTERFSFWVLYNL